MAEHPAVKAARTANGSVYQCTLVLNPHYGPQPPLQTLPTKPDLDPSAVLSAVTDIGWELVAAAPIHFAGSTAVTCIYVFRRRG